MSQRKPSDRPPPGPRRRQPKPAWPLVALALLVAIGIALEALGLVDWRAAVGWARGRQAGWALAAAIIAVQTAMFALALPGSAMVWVVAVLYPAPLAALILTAGGTAGALAAYLFADRLARPAPQDAGGQRLYRLLRSRGDFFTLCALRVLPGVPHSLLNYTSALLRLPLPAFLAAAAVGLAVKSFLYSSAIGGLADSDDVADLLDAAILAPLFIIALLLLAGGALRRRWLRPKD